MTHAVPTIIYWDSLYLRLQIIWGFFENLLSNFEKLLKKLLFTQIPYDLLRNSLESIRPTSLLHFSFSVCVFSIFCYGDFRSLFFVCKIHICKSLSNLATQARECTATEK